MDFTQANDKLGSRQSRKVANNTYMQRRDAETIAIRLHETDVVTFKANGDIILDSGGWKTPTTKSRMNEYVRHVSQERGIWYFNNVPYADGMTIHSDGTITGAGTDPKADIKLRKRVNGFAKDYVSALRAGEVGKPGLGDCFFCGMRTVDGNKPLGEVCGDKADHLLSHIEEKYYVPSLLVNALEAMPCSQVMRWAVAGAWEGKKEQWGDFVWQQITKSLARYIMRQLGMVS